jgi:cysteine-rich repeat protein
MNIKNLNLVLVSFLLSACADDDTVKAQSDGVDDSSSSEETGTESESGSSEEGSQSGDGDGDGDPSTTTGDGDGDPSTTTGDGDGDGDPSTTTGDGDGDTSTTTGDGDGDGDGDPSTTSGDGDGDGDPSTTSGDGDGDPSTTSGDGDGDGDPSTTTGDGDGDGDPSTTTGDGDGDGDGDLDVCGDGLVTGIEECDDGNTFNEDGCSSQCEWNTLCSSYELSVGAGGLGTGATQIIYQDPIQYGLINTSPNRGFYMFDVELYQLYEYLTPNQNSQLYGFTVYGDHVYLAGAEGAIVNVSDPSNPVEVFSLGAWVQMVATSPQRLYSINSNLDFQIFDLANPSNPSLIGELNVGGGYENFIRAGNYGFMSGSNNGFDVLDLSNEAQPTFVTNYSYGNGAEYRSMELVGDYLYLTSVFWGLEIVDVSDPTSPAHVSLLDFVETRSVGVTSDGHLAFVKTSSEIVLVDVGNPYSPQILDTYPSSSSLQDRIEVYPVNPVPDWVQNPTGNQVAAALGRTSAWKVTCQ